VHKTGRLEGWCEFLLGDLGVPPKLIFPQDWVIEGVEKTFVNALDIHCHCHIGALTVSCIINPIIS
jgi:hypothetical protein